MKWREYNEIIILFIYLFISRTAVRMAPRILETVKGKLSLGARILQKGGKKRIFEQLFGVREGERLLKASQCCLSTTAGPIAGLLFVSTQRVAFCSERSIKFSSSNGELVRFHYKVDDSHHFIYTSTNYLAILYCYLYILFFFFFFCRSQSPWERYRE